MISITQPQYWPIALCIGIGLIIGKRFVDNYLLLPYQVPSHQINITRKLARKSIWRLIIFAISITPLGLVLQIHRPNFVVVLDDSSSMQSTDTSPTRLDAGLRLARNIHAVGSFEHCYSLVSQAQLPCSKYTTLQKSGTSVTDLVLLAITDYPKRTILVISDNGANNGIEMHQLDQELQRTANKFLIWTDIQPNTKQLIISGTKLDTVTSKNNTIMASKYFQTTTTNNNTIDALAEQQKDILLQQERSYNLPLNYAIYLFVLILATLMSMQHFTEHLATQRQIKKK